MANNLVPNSFQCPNFLIDKLDYYLTPAETKVLVKAVREILGWNDKIPLRKNAIGLSVFVKGKPKHEVLGCGLGLGSVREALQNLDKFRILVKMGPPTQDGQTYWLQDDESQIDWDALIARRAEWDDTNRKRTQKATQKSLQSRGVTSDVRGNVGRNTGITSDVTQGITSDVNKETHEKPNETQNPSLREQAQNGEMTAETEAALLCGFGRGGKQGVADPSQDQAQFIKYGNEAVQAFIDNGGDIGRLQNERNARIEAITNFASQPDFDLERFISSVHTCIVIGGVQPDNLGCIFDTYNDGGDYQERIKKNGGKNGGNSRRGSKTGRKGATSTGTLTPEQRRQLQNL